MRLFIASSAKLYDYSAIREDFSAVLRGKWVEEENLHLTWVFLGERSSPEPFLALLEEIADLRSSCALQALGSFGRPPHILYTRSFDKLIYKKAESFQALGIPMERFKPHVTLCRIKKIEEWRAFKNLRKKYQGKKLGEILPEIALYQSTLTEKGPIYKKIESVTT